MKKFLFMPVLMLLLITGCSFGGSAEKSTTVCTLSTDQQGVAMEEKVTLTSSDDECTKQQSHLSFDVSSMLTSGATIDTYKEQLESTYKDKIGGLKGVSMKSSVEGNKIIFDITIDYTKADMTALQTAGLVSFSGGSSSKVKYISLKQTMDGLKGQNYKCKKTVEK